MLGGFPLHHPGDSRHTAINSPGSLEAVAFAADDVVAPAPVAVNEVARPHSSVVIPSPLG